MDHQLQYQHPLSQQHDSQQQAQQQQQVSPLSTIFTFRLEQSDNGSLFATVLQRDPTSGNATSIYRYHHRYHHAPRVQDDVGALYYVVAVIIIYGCSILMMIASYIRKNKVDRRLNRCLKEMAKVRKMERRMTLMSATAKVARKDGLVMAEAGSINCTASPSASGRGSTASAQNDTALDSTVDTSSPAADIELSIPTRHNDVIVSVHHSASKSASFQFLAVDPLFGNRRDQSASGGRNMYESGATRPLSGQYTNRASSPVLIVSNHNSIYDDDDYNGDSDCSGVGAGGTSDRSNSALDLRASGMSLNIPPPVATPHRRHRQSVGSVREASKRRPKSVKLCVPGSPGFYSNVASSGNSATGLQPETPTSITGPETETSSNCPNGNEESSDRSSQLVTSF